MQGTYSAKAFAVALNRARAEITKQFETFSATCRLSTAMTT